MASAAEQAREELRKDFILQVSLERGIVNGKDAARYLRDKRGVKGSIDAISQEVYKFNPDPDSGSVGRGFEAFRRSKKEHRTGLSSLIVKRNGQTQQRLSRLIGAVSVASQEVLRFIPDTKAIGIVLPSSKLSDAKSIFKEENHVRVKESLDEVRILPKEGDRRTPGVLDAALTILTIRGIRPWLVTSAYYEHFIPVDSDEGEEALEILKEASSD